MSTHDSLAWHAVLFSLTQSGHVPDAELHNIKRQWSCKFIRLHSNYMCLTGGIVKEKVGDTPRKAKAEVIVAADQTLANGHNEGEVLDDLEAGRGMYTRNCSRKIEITIKALPAADCLILYATASILSFMCFFMQNRILCKHYQVLISLGKSLHPGKHGS